MKENKVAGSGMGKAYVRPSYKYQFSSKIDLLVGHTASNKPTNG